MSCVSPLISVSHRLGGELDVCMNTHTFVTQCNKTASVGVYPGKNLVWDKERNKYILELTYKSCSLMAMRHSFVCSKTTGSFPLSAGLDVSTWHGSQDLI